MSQISKKELSLLLQAFFPDISEREYIIDLIFYKNAFMSKNLTDILDVIEQTEKLIKNGISTKENVLYVVQNEEPKVKVSGANDEYFTPLVDRIEDLEP